MGKHYNPPPSAQQSQISVATTAKESSCPSNDGEVRFELPAKQMIMIFIGMAAAQFLAAIDATIVATAIPTIGSEFNSLDRAPWVATAYLLTYNAFHAVFASFSDSFGRKPVILVGIAIFVVFSALCAAATSLEMLTIMRAMQGIGGSAIYAMFNIIPSDLVPLHRRGMWQGASNSLWAVAAVAGPLVGGYFTDKISWRYAFIINVPIGFFAMTLIILYLETPAPRKDLKSEWKSLDYVGIVISIFFSVIFLVTFSLGGIQFPWTSWQVLTGFAISLVLFIMLLVWELRYAANPLFPVRLFKGRTVLLMYFMNFLYTAAFYAILYYTPLFYQIVKGDTAANSGVKLIPIELCLTSAGIVAGIIQQRFFIYRPLLVFGTFMFSVGLGLFCLLNENSPDIMGYGSVCVCGIGLGFIFSSNITAVQCAVEDKDQGMATGMVTYLRSLGGTFGVSIGSVTINNRLVATLPSISQLTPAQIAGVVGSATFIRESLPVELQAIVIHQYVLAVRWIWYIMTGAALLSMVCCIFIKHYSLRRDLDPRKVPGDLEEAFTLKEKLATRPSRDVQDLDLHWNNQSTARLVEKIEVNNRFYTIKKKVLVDKRLWEDSATDEDEVVVVLFATEDYYYV